MIPANQERLSQLKEIIDRYVARGGFESVADSISGASFVVNAFSGHLFLWDDNLTPQEDTAIQSVIYLLEKLK